MPISIQEKALATSLAGVFLKVMSDLSIKALAETGVSKGWTPIVVAQLAFCRAYEQSILDAMLNAKKVSESKLDNEMLEVAGEISAQIIKDYRAHVAAMLKQGGF